jgi:signal transduction histidine kinase
VRVGYEPGALHLTVTDDGRGAASTNGSVSADRSGRHGHGLIGMRERVAAYGGTFCAGPRVGGGFTVDATIPFEVDA